MASSLKEKSDHLNPKNKGVLTGDVLQKTKGTGSAPKRTGEENRRGDWEAKRPGTLCMKAACNKEPVKISLTVGTPALPSPEKPLRRKITNM